MALHASLSQAWTFSYCIVHSQTMEMYGQNVFIYLLFVGDSLNGNFNLKTLDLSANQIASLKVCV